MPTLANAILGSGAIDFTAGTGDKAKFMADVLTNLTGDFINYATSVPGVNDKIANGQWFDAGVDLTGTAAGAGTVRTILVEAFDRAVKARVAVVMRLRVCRLGGPARRRVERRERVAAVGDAPVLDHAVAVRVEELRARAAVGRGGA